MMKAREVLHELDPETAVSNLASWVRLERGAAAQVIAHLAILEREQIHVGAGFSSLFGYCHDKLGYSRDASYKRTRAAKAALAHPEILDYLESGELSLSGVLILAKHLDGSVFGAELLEKARGHSCRAIKAMVAAWFPEENSPRGKFRVRPVGDELVKLEVVVSTEVAIKLELAREIDRRRNPEGDVATILDEALSLFVAAVNKRKWAPTEGSREPALARSQTGTAPADVRRVVHDRDCGRCQFKGTEKVCGERASVELEHVEPRAPDGANSIESERPLCGVHKRQEAELEFGADAVYRWRRRETEDRLLSALINFGFSRSEAKTRARQACAELGSDAELEPLCRRASRPEPDPRDRAAEPPTESPIHHQRRTPS